MHWKRFQYITRYLLVLGLVLEIMIQFVSCFFELFFVSHSIVNRVMDLDAVLDEDKAKLGEILF